MLLAEPSKTSTLTSTDLLDISVSQKNDTINHEVSFNPIGLIHTSSVALDSSNQSLITTLYNFDNISNSNTVDFQILKSSTVLSCPTSISNSSSTSNHHNLDFCQSI
jgi:hypothetical protein